MYDNEERFLRFAWSLILLRLSMGAVDWLLGLSHWWQRVSADWHCLVACACAEAVALLLSGLLWLFVLSSAACALFLVFALGAWLAGVCRGQADGGE